MRKVLFGLATLGSLALLGGGCGKKEPVVAQGPPPLIDGVAVETVERQSLPTTFEATGTVKARLQATLSSKVMSRVVSVAAREGDPVKAGAVLIALDPRELQSAVKMAGANLNAASVGVGNASTAATIEARTSAARIAQAEEAVAMSVAGLNAARSRLDLALAGPRTQERNQAKLAVDLASSNVKLAQTELERIQRLVEAGALAGRQLDAAQNALEVAQAQYASAVEGEKIAQEGTRAQEIRSAREAVAQAEAAVRQSQANLRQARAAALQVRVRRQEIEAARAQTSQASAALNSAKVSLSYATVAAPFDGVVVSRLADPGTMAAPGVPLMAVEGRELRLEAVVPESVLRQVRLGTVAPVKIDALGEQQVQGRVTEITPQGDASTHSFVVKLTVPRNAGMKSGMFGRAQFPVGSQSRLTVPVEAVWDREGLHYVYAINTQDIARLRIVTLGERAGDRYEVLSGLSEGDRVVTNGRERVTDGAKVQS